MALCSAQAKPKLHFRKDSCSARGMAFVNSSIEKNVTDNIGSSLLYRSRAAIPIFPQANRRVMCRSGPEQKPSPQEIERQLLIDLIVQYVFHFIKAQCVFPEALSLVFLCQHLSFSCFHVMILADIQLQGVPLLS